MPATIARRLCCAAAPLILAAAMPIAGAQVYKWTDDKGVINYSNTPPAGAKTKKNVSVVEDRVSVYSADPAVTQATQDARDRRGAPPPPPAPAVATIPPPPPPLSRFPPVSTFDPCVDGYDPIACGGYYEGVPVFSGRRRPPRLAQPQLPPGAIAGNVNQNTGFTPGLSTQAPLGAQPAPVGRRPAQQTAPIREIPANR